MRPLKKLSGLFAGQIDRNVLFESVRRHRALCALVVIVLLAAFAFALLWPQSEHKPTRYELETAGGEINFDASDAQVHTAANGIAVVRPRDEAAELPADATTPVEPAMLTTDPAAILREESPTHSGFTMPVPMDDDSIGVLTIPDLELSVRVYETGDDMADMERGAAHFKSTSAWEGNIGLSAHNVNFSGTAGYFYSLHTLQTGAVIRYETALGSREYAVESLTEINETDWSLLGRTEDNRITLITCISGKPSLRLCVQGVEIQN